MTGRRTPSTSLEQRGPLLDGLREAVGHGPEVALTNLNQQDMLFHTAYRLRRGLIALRNMAFIMGS